MPRRVTSADRGAVRRLHAAGKGRNEIAREIGRSVATVTKLATELGLTFDRAATADATAARQADARARRTALALALLDDAEQLRAQLFAPCTVHAFGGRDNTYNEAHLDRPPHRDQRDIVHAVHTAVAASLRLDERDADAGAEGARSMLGDLAAKLGAAWRGEQPAEPADDA